MLSAASDDRVFRPWVKACLALARRTVDVICSPETREVFTTADLAAAPPAADLRLRVFVREHAEEESSSTASLQALQQLGWDVRTGVAVRSRGAFVLVDERFAFVFPGGTRGDTVFDSATVAALRAHFEELWTTSVEWLYDDFVGSSHPSISVALQEDQGRWNRVIEELARNPQGLWSIGPRDFEELVAELLRRRGFGDISLTSATRDGGRDVLVATKGVLGRHLYVVECKRHRPDRPVGVSLVRSLYGVMEAERATAALLVTISRFTRDAVTFSHEVRHRLSLADYRDVVSWLRRLQG